MGYFELKKSGDTGFMFNLKAANHEIILTSQIYASKEGANDGIASVQKNAAKELMFERKTAADDSAYFVLKASNGQVIGTSEMYSSRSARDHGIESVRANGATTTVKEIE